MAPQKPDRSAASHAGVDSCLTQPSLRGILFTRSFAVTAVVYLLLLCCLFWRLFVGQIWNSNALMQMLPPFAPAHVIEAVPYVCFAEGDFSDQFIFFQEYQHRAAEHGRFPTWNPFIYMGQPFHADGQSAMLYPFDWIYFFVDSDSARGWMAILRLWVSGASLFCLLRKLDLAPSAAFTGGAVWMFCSFNMHWLAWPQSNASLWMPVLMLVVDFLLVAPSVKHTAAASLAAAPLFLAGHPGTEYVAAFTIGLYALCRLTSLHRQGIARPGIALRTGALLCSMILGLLIAAAAVLPLWLQIRQSYDYLDPTGLRGSVKPLQPTVLWLMLMPERFGRSRGAFPTNLYIGPGNYVEITLWFGALALAVATCIAFSSILSLVLSFRKKSRRYPYGFLVNFGIAGLVLSIMLVFNVEPVNFLANHLPGAGLTNLRRFQMATGLGGAILTAVGIQRIVECRDRAASVLASLIAIGLCTLAGGQVLVHWHDHQQQLTDAFVALRNAFGAAGARQLANSMLVQSAVWRMRVGVVILLAGSIALLWISARNLKGKPISASLRIVFIALVVLDVMLPAIEWQPIAPRQLALPEPPPVLRAAIAQSGQGRMFATGAILAPNASMHFDFRDIRGYELPHNLRLSRLLKRLNLYGFDGRALIMPTQFYPHMKPDLQAYLNRTCVQCVLTRVGNTEVIFPNPNAYPRAYLARSAIQLTNENQAMETLLDGGVDLRRRSVFEGPGESQLTDPANDSATIPPTITLDEPERIVIHTQTTARQLLVLGDRMDIGWEVTVDGHPADALTANYLFRGVFVPAGKHNVEWTYHAPGLAAGVAISVITLLVVMAMLFAKMLFGKTRPD
jgi:hypothetical protein